MTNLSSSIVNSLYNIQLMNFAGENGVAAYGAIMYVNFIFMSIFFGYSIGSAPITSFHYGAKNHRELKSLFKKSLTFIGVSGIVLVVLAQLSASTLAWLFVGYDSDLFEMALAGFRIYCLVYLINGFNIFGSSFFTALNNGLVSLPSFSPHTVISNCVGAYFAGCFRYCRNLVCSKCSRSFNIMCYYFLLCGTKEKI